MSYVRAVTMTGALLLSTAPSLFASDHIELLKKIVEVLESQDKKLGAHDQRLNDHERRLVALEGSRSFESPGIRTPDEPKKIATPTIPDDEITGPPPKITSLKLPQRPRYIYYPDPTDRSKVYIGASASGYDPKAFRK